VTTAIGSSIDRPASSRAVVTGQSGHHTAIRLSELAETDLLTVRSFRSGPSSIRAASSLSLARRRAVRASAHRVVVAFWMVAFQRGRAHRAGACR
jgi:hypothetical protein